MITVPLINWQPIATLPDDRKDGREMLLWTAGNADVGVWNETQWWGGGAGWNETTEGGPLSGVTYWADINSPE